MMDVKDSAENSITRLFEGWLQALNEEPLAPEAWAPKVESYTVEDKEDRTVLTIRTDNDFSLNMDVASHQMGVDLGEQLIGKLMIPQSVGVGETVPNEPVEITVTFK